jgi:lipoate-protein ligase B
VRNERVISAEQGRTRICADFSTIGYKEAWELQLDLVAARKAGHVSDVILLVEHPPVFTLGRRGGRENLAVSEEFLKERGIPIVHVERGGNITYHGPGQLVGYPIMDLHAAGLSVTDYVGSLEDVMIRTAAHWGVRAGRNRLNRGIWVGNSKLGSIGIAIRRGISFHGFAFNVNLSLEPFSWINPCGLQGIGVTSMELELGHELPMNEVREQLRCNFEAVFGVELVSIEPAMLRSVLKEHPDCIVLN